LHFNEDLKSIQWKTNLVYQCAWQSRCSWSALCCICDKWCCSFVFFIIRWQNVNNLCTKITTFFSTAIT